MAKINLDNVGGGKTFTVLADKAYENGLVVGIGNLVENEFHMYEAVDATAKNFALITTPEVDRTSKSSGIDFTNEEGSHMRVHLLGHGDIVTVEDSIHGATVEAGQKLGVSGNQFVDASDADAVAEVIEVTQIGADARPAISIRIY